MRPSAFVRQVAALVVRHFANGNVVLEQEVRSRLAKFWFGNDGSVHYELWLHEHTSQLEIGLHCESSESINRLLYTRLDRSLLDIQARLGDSLWLEEWDHGWVRLYETMALWPLDGTRADEVSTRLSLLIEQLQPLLEQASPGPGSPAY